MAQHLPPASLRILKALCYFHYLTKPQMVQLGLAKSVASLENHALIGLAPPRDPETGDELTTTGRRLSSYVCGTIRRGNRDPGEKPGKQHYLYYLTQAGLDRVYHEYEDEFLADGGDLRFDDIWIPKPKDALSNEFHHRREYVSVHIAIRQWAADVGATIDFWTHDYQGDPKRPHQRGRPPSINLVTWDVAQSKQVKPDGIFGLTYRGVSRLFVLELHHRSSTAQVVDQLYRNFCASEAILTKTGYQTPFDPFVLSTHTHEPTRKAVEKKVRIDPIFADVRLGLRQCSVSAVAETLSQAVGQH